MKSRIAATAAVAAAGFAALPVLADHINPGAINPTTDEQVGIYEINRARSDPADYGEEIGLDLSGVAARPPLAVNRNLVGSAHFHAQLMLDHHEYGHTSALLGIGPNQMAVDNGYDLFAMGLGNNWTTVNSIESIMRSVNQVGTPQAAVKTLIVDKDVPGAGHRVHLLAIESYGDHREIGFGWAAGKDSFPEFGLPKSLPTKLCAIHTARRATGMQFVTGVVFHDANGNRRFDRDEGMGGVTVDIGGVASAVSMPSGGYAVEVDPGTYLVTCSGGMYPGSSLAVVTVGSENVAVDFHAGRASGEVGFAWRDGIPAGPEVSISVGATSGTAPLLLDLSGEGLSDGFYSWDFGNGDSDEGPDTQETYESDGLFPLVLTGIDATGSGRALAMVAVTDPGFPGEGLSAPTDGALHIAKGLVKRVIKVAGKDQAKLSGTLEVPGGFLPDGQEVQVLVAGALRTFTLDAKGKGVLPDGSKIVLKAKWPKDGSGAPAGTIAKVTATLKGDLSTVLDAAGLRDRTESRALTGVPAGVHLAGRPWTAAGNLATKAVEGKTGKGTLTAE
jgi:PKD repeat protein